MDYTAANQINQLLRGRVLHALYAHGFMPVEDGLQFYIKGSNRCSVIRITHNEETNRFDLHFLCVCDKTKTLDEVAAHYYAKGEDVIGYIEIETGIWLDSGYRSHADP